MIFYSFAIKFLILLKSISCESESTIIGRVHTFETVGLEDEVSSCKTIDEFLLNYKKNQY